ncbi:MAG: RNA polymerase subunit sigma-24 [Candidatus Meridianibacter frigidus]|nr:MAG: RNA polymerase subunit sigma-24 [Candidatus Eremiobacteraeota bacterium]
MERLERRDDVDNFEASYIKYRELVYGVAFRLLRDHDEAEDVAQQVFLTLWAKPFTFRGGNLEAWLTTVTRNYSITLLRRHRSRPFGRLYAEADRVADPNAFNLEDEVMIRQLSQRVRESISSLKPAQRSLVLAAFFSGETHEMIARTTLMPLGTVKTRIRAGLRRMLRRDGHALRHWVTVV